MVIIYIKICYELLVSEGFCIEREDINSMPKIENSREEAVICHSSLNEGPVLTVSLLQNYIILEQRSYIRNI